MKMCIDRPEELSLDLSMHEDETCGTYYVMCLTSVALMANGSEPHDLWVGRQAWVLGRDCMAYLLW